MNKRVYFDHASTSPCTEKAIKAVATASQRLQGNPSSLHSDGQKVRGFLDFTKKELLQDFYRSEKDDIIFTSGGTESNNLAITGVLNNLSLECDTIITSEIEHPSVHNVCEAYKKKGWKVIRLATGKDGVVNTEYLAEMLTNYKVGIVTIMSANNETGIIQPIQEIGRICREHNVIFHTDCVQGLSYFCSPSDFDNVDLFSGSAHKLGGLVGTGFLYVRNGVPLSPILHGGGQQNGLRSGTENVMGIGTIRMCLPQSDLSESDHVKYLRDMKEKKAKLEQGLLEIEDLQIIGKDSERLDGTTAFTAKGINGEALLLSLDSKGISCSTGSACSSGNQEPSRVLKAMGLTDKEANSMIRLSFNHDNTMEEIDYVIESIKDSIEFLREEL